MCRPGHLLTPSTHGHRVAWRVLTVGHCSQRAVYDGDPAVEGTVHPPSVGAGGGEAGLARRGEGTARLGGAHGSRVSDRDTRLVLSATAVNYIVQFEIWFRRKGKVELHGRIASCTQGCRFTKMIGRAQLLRPLADPAWGGGGHNFDGAT